MKPPTITPGMRKDERRHRRELCLVGAWLYERRFVVATEGNFSLRIAPHRVLASPAGANKGLLNARDLVVTDLDGRRLRGRSGPSSELPMHLEIYRQRPDVRAICHAHPPVATGFAVAGLPLDKALLAECVLDLGCIPVAPYATPGTRELGETLRPFVAKYNAILLANHGVVTFGPDLLTAFFRMETTEQIARVTLVTHLIGRQTLLTKADVECLLASRLPPRSGRANPSTRTRTGAPAREEEDPSRDRRELDLRLSAALRDLHDRR